MYEIFKYLDTNPFPFLVILTLIAMWMGYEMLTAPLDPNEADDDDDDIFFDGLAT